MDGYLGVDVGSVTTKCAGISEESGLIAYNCLFPRASRPLLPCWSSGRFRTTSADNRLHRQTSRGIQRGKEAKRRTLQATRNYNRTAIEQGSGLAEASSPQR